RVSDKIVCRAYITDGSANVFIGGAAVQTNSFMPEGIFEEVVELVENGATLVLGAGEIVVGGLYNSAVRIGAGLASIPYMLDSVDAAVGVQKEIAEGLNYNFRSDGAKQIGEALKPVGAYVQEKITATRDFSEEHIGLGATAIVFGGVEAGVEIVGVVTGGKVLKSFIDVPNAASLADAQAAALLKVTKEAHVIYAKEIPLATRLTQEIAGPDAIVSARAKEAGSAANRLQRALDNKWASEISTAEAAIDNLWDAVGTRAVLKNPTPKNMDTLVDNLDAAIRNGDLEVPRVNSLVGKDGIPYLTTGHLAQLKDAAESVGKKIDTKMVEYDSGYTAGMVYVKYPSGVRGEIQLMGPKVLAVADAEHIPYDAFLNKPYAGGFTPDTLPQASLILDPLRDSAKNLSKAEQQIYRDYLKDHYTNARMVESGQTPSPVTLPREVPDNLAVENLIKANQELKILKQR
ncbi:hypothetical protein, partial [Massilia mucilaginosa]|uniref:hypothetical protein n=1 Tax=Massilia mucilaginosa TaxID=2609282 RepID=UPI001CB72948